MLGAVVIAAVRHVEAQALVHLLGHAAPGWLVLAASFQACTYGAQAIAWWIVVRAGRAPMGIGFSYQLSLAKLFLDQALPSAGISGTVVVAQAMERHRVPRPVVMGAVVVETVTYYAAYVVALASAVVFVTVKGYARTSIIVAGALFSIFAIAIIVAFLHFAGRPVPTGRLAQTKYVKKTLALVADADPRLSRSPWLLSAGLALQLGIVLLDAATVWAAVRSLGADGSPTGIFASFMISALLRTVGLVPGGLGTFEAASVLTLRLAGLSTSVALSATLLFRGLSFWLPMLPGLLVSRRLAKTV